MLEQASRQIITRGILLFVCVSAAATIACGSGQFTDPEGRTGLPALLMSCDTVTASALKCRTSSYCSGDYPCPGLVPSDLTAVAMWTVDDPRVAQIVAPGTVIGVGVGNTIVRAQATGFSSTYHNIGVFAGTVPLPTFGLEGSVYTGPSSNTGGINGATVDVVSGLIAGARAITGTAAAPVSGWLPSPIPAVAGTFIIDGVPAGTVHLRASADGFQFSEQDVTFTTTGGPGFVTFQLQRQQ